MIDFLLQEVILELVAQQEVFALSPDWEIVVMVNQQNELEAPPGGTMNDIPNKIQRFYLMNTKKFTKNDFEVQNIFYATLFKKFKVGFKGLLEENLRWGQDGQAKLQLGEWVVQEGGLGFQENLHFQLLESQGCLRRGLGFYTIIKQITSNVNARPNGAELIHFKQ